MDSLPAEPFAAWLDRKWALYRLEHEDCSLEDFAATVALSSRRLDDIRKRRQRTVNFGTVDRSLVWEGSTLLWDVYPEYAPDLSTHEEVAA